MTWGVVLAAVIVALKERDGLAQALSPRIGLQTQIRAYRKLVSRRIPAGLFVMSLLVYTLAMAAEIWTTYGQGSLPADEARLAYSGNFDWADAVSYTIGMTAMTLNNILVAPRVRHRINSGQ